MDAHRPWALHSSIPGPPRGQARRSQASPVKPAWQAHRDVSRLQWPRLEHSASACALSSATGESNHAGPVGQVRCAQSPPIHPLSHVHLYVGWPEHVPWPEHSSCVPGQLVMGLEAYPQSPRVPTPPKPLDESKPLKQWHTPDESSQVPRPEHTSHSRVPTVAEYCPPPGPVGWLIVTTASSPVASVTTIVAPGAVDSTSTLIRMAGTSPWRCTKVTRWSSPAGEHSVVVAPTGALETDTVPTTAANASRSVLASPLVGICVVASPSKVTLKYVAADGAAMVQLSSCTSCSCPEVMGSSPRGHSCMEQS
mmetsp:Transcript_13191/g.50508  ORF Transcript_13191/g.50508 Transcript_13191/m.50508 type:complete len:309 (-) Transcript_13191:505-1431(-)